MATTPNTSDTEYPDLPEPQLLQRVLDTYPDPIFVKDRLHRWIAVNAAFCRLAGHPREALIGRSDPDIWLPEQAAVFWAMDDVVFASNTEHENEEQLTDADGVERTIWTRKYPLHADDGRVIGLCDIITDITTLKARVVQAERIEVENREQKALLAAQAELLATISVPVVEVWDQVLLIPLVGELNRERAARLQENTLYEISRVRARFVLFDLTGIPTLDTNATAALLRTATAAALLGCQSLLCGMRPALAQTVIALGINLGKIVPCATLRDGLALVMQRIAKRA